jgi:GntR family transcriptional repressor for pyruvate dehydrogenase complex
VVSTQRGAAAPESARGAGEFASSGEAGGAVARNGEPQSSSARAQRRLPKAAEVLADELRGRILRESTPAGTQLTTEAELIEEHGFSRGTVREALRLLEVEGLIAIRRGPRGGVSVARPDLSQVSRTLSLLFTLDATPLSAFFAFRKLVEPYAARLAATTANEEARRRLVAFAEATADDDSARATNFHGVLAECADNEILRVILVALHDVLDRHVRLEVIDEREVSTVVEVHRRIARAIMDGQPDAAERLMRRHLEAFEALLEEQGRLDQPIVPRSRWRS